MADKPSKVLVIGSGPIVIGQAAEFDYAGTQACKALREEGVTTVLVNSNPATIMTDAEVADHVYVEPLTVEVLERIIAQERPDGLLPTLGGQTGLNLAVELADAGVLDRYGVRLPRHLARDHQAGGGSPPVPRDAPLHRRARAAQRDRHDARRGARRRRAASACPSPCAPPTRSAARAADSSPPTRNCRRWRAAASPQAPSARCSSRSRSRAGRSWSTR